VLRPPSLYRTLVTAHSLLHAVHHTLLTTVFTTLFTTLSLPHTKPQRSVAKRKGNKVIVLYEIEAVIKWEVTLKNSAGETISTAKVCLYECFSLCAHTHTV